MHLMMISPMTCVTTAYFCELVALIVLLWLNECVKQCASCHFNMLYTGKMMAQCAHASLLAYQRIVRRYKRTPDNERCVNAYKWLKRWNDGGCAKIALKISSEEQARSLENEAVALGLPAYHVLDAGRTQIQAGSMTVVSVGPGPVELVDKCCSKLKLM